MMVYLTYSEIEYFAHYLLYTKQDGSVIKEAKCKVSDPRLKSSNKATNLSHAVINRPMH